MSAVMKPREPRQRRPPPNHRMPLVPLKQINQQVAGGLTSRQRDARQTPRERAEAVEARRAKALLEGDALGMLLAESAAYPLLSVEEERALARRARLGDEAARQELVVRNIRLAADWARKLSTRMPASSAVDVADLTQEATIGLMRAIETFDPDSGYKFSTYASWWIRQAIQRASHTGGDLIRLPEYIHTRRAQIDRAAGDLEAEAIQPTPARIAERAGLRERVVRETLVASQRHVSLEAPVNASAGRPGAHQRSVAYAHDERTLGESLADPTATVEIDEADERLDLLMRQGRVVDAMVRLMANPRSHFTRVSARILWLRYGEGRSLDETAGQVFADGLMPTRVTRERIRQLEASALKTLRAALDVEPGTPVIRPVKEPKQPPTEAEKARRRAELRAARQSRAVTTGVMKEAD